MKKALGIQMPIQFKILIFAIFVAVLLGMGSSFGSGGLHAYAPGAAPIEMRFTYTPADASALFQSLGDGGRYVYTRLICIDFIFITAFAMVQNILLGWVMGRDAAQTKWRFLALISWGRALFDILENILLLAYITRFPDSPGVLVQAAAVFTTLKFILLYAWLAAVPAAFAARFVVKAHRNAAS